ncbi:MAG: hypothetical protein ACRDKB_10150 [Actinomycetota bacterium]
MRRYIVVAVTLTLLVPACDGGDDADAPAEVTGVVVEIDSRGLGDVRGFTVRDGDEVYEISIDPNIDYGFNLGHLNEHRATAEPVRVELEERGDQLVARSIEDA